MTEEIGMIFKPDGKSVKQLFCNTDSFYSVPNYQRPYCWESEQIEQLWDDLIGAYEANDENYFLGPIILIKTDNDYYDVVDGQQRITTLTILFCVLRDFYLGNDDLILDAVKSHLDHKYRLRLITQAFYQNQFEQEVLNKVLIPDEKHIKEKRKNNNYLNAAIIFQEKLKEFCEHEGLAALKRFSDYIFDRVVVITITCHNQKHAIKLFQVLNYRGLDLTNADLIKSYLYGEIPSDQEKEKAQFISTWDQIETVSRERKESVNDLLTYYQYFLLARNPKRTLFEELEQQFKSKNPNSVVFDFKKYVDAFSEVKNSQSSVYYSFAYLPNQVFWKSILATAKKVDYSEMEILCKQLRTLYYCYWIAGFTTSKIKQISFSLIGWLKEKKNIEEIINNIQKKMNEDNVLKKVRDNLENDAYGYPWVKPLLMLVEYNQVDNSKPAFISMDRDIHADHILPQAWKGVADWNNCWTDSSALQWLNKIGNLTLVSASKNEMAKHHKFEEKKRIYKGEHGGGSTSFLLSQRVADNPRRTENEVRARQEWILNEIERLFEIDFEALPKDDVEKISLIENQEIPGISIEHSNQELAAWTEEEILDYLNHLKERKGKWTFYYYKALALSDRALGYDEVISRANEIAGGGFDGKKMGGLQAVITRTIDNIRKERLDEIEEPEVKRRLYSLNAKYAEIIRKYFRIT
jgi:uncharacterized protein with ParB-like and HNH nuclease domain